MPSRTEVSGLLSLSAEPVAPNRAKTARSGGQEFGRILQASSQPAAAAHRQDTPRANSAQGGREPSAQSRREPSASVKGEPSAGAKEEPSTAARKEPSAGVNKEPSTQTPEHARASRQTSADQNAKDSNSKTSGQVSEQSEDLEALVKPLNASPELSLSQLASARGGDMARELVAELDLDKPLEALSAEELEALKAQVEQVLQGLLNKLQAGELTQEQKQALVDLLESLEAGAKENPIAQALEAVTLPLRSDAKDVQMQQASLRDFLSPSGQAYLAKLADQLKATPERGPVVQGSEADLFGKLGEEALEAEQALNKKAEVNALKEKFSDLLQLAQADRASGRPLDLGQASPGTSALASLEAAGSRQLQPTERGFVVQSEVRVPVGQQPQWSQAVGQRVLWMAAQNLSSAELRLDPPDLGPMQVKVSVHNDQISVNFTSAQATVREALDQGSARLREMFESEGLDLVNVDVSDQSEQQLAEEQQRRSGQGRGVAGGDEPGEPKVTSIWVSNRLVDHYSLCLARNAERRA